MKEREAKHNYNEIEKECMYTRCRGFEVCSEFAEQGINLPQRQTKRSAGYDFEASKTVTIQPNQRMLVPTGIKAYMLDDEVLMIFVRSGHAWKKGLTLANNVGIIDTCYYNNPDNEGHIQFMLKNTTETPITLEKGERVGQGVFTKYLKTDDDNAEGERLGGFGSTGK